MRAQNRFKGNFFQIGPRSWEKAGLRDWCVWRKSRRYDEARQDRQFLQTDPVGYEDDLNLYAYVQNDPLNRNDPTGRVGELAAAGCGLTVAVGCAPGAAVGAAVEVVIYVGVACLLFCEDVWNGIFNNDAARPSDGMPIQEGATVERPGRTGSRDQISRKPGGEDADAAANEDFDANAESDTVQDIEGGGRTGQTAGGDNITVRPGTETREPTVEITRGNGRERDTDKYRYGPPRRENH